MLRLSLVLLLVLAPAAAAAVAPTPVSVTPAGTFGNDGVDAPQITPDGRFVLFTSEASNLIAPDANRHDRDLYLRDMKKGTTERVNVSSSGKQGNSSSFEDFNVSGNGRWVVFTSFANNIVKRLPGEERCHGGGGSSRAQISCFAGAGDDQHAYLRDRKTRKTTLLDRNPDGTRADGGGFSPDISRDGSTIVFVSNGLAGDKDPSADIFAMDRASGDIKLISPEGKLGKATFDCLEARLSADGTHAMFSCYEDNALDVEDAFVEDLATGEIEQVNLGPDGKAGWAVYWDIAPDGGSVLMVSDEFSEGGKGRNLYVRDLGSQTTELLADGLGGDNEGPAFTPDGATAAFEATKGLVAGDKNGGRDVYTVPVAGGKPKLISSAARKTIAYGAAVSAGARYVAYEQGNAKVNNYELQIVRAGPLG